MEERSKKLIDKYEADFDKIASKQAWEPKDIEMMTHLQKLMYYIELRCAMKESAEKEGYGEDWENESRYSYSRNPQTGHFMPRRSGNNPYYYDRDSGMSGRRYYDSERESAVHELHRVMDSRNDPETRAILMEAIRKIESK